jgi:octaprenyl-diphosphate synthase
LAFKQGTDDEKQFWTRTLHLGQQKEGDLQVAVDLLLSHNAIEDSIEAARCYADSAIRALNVFEDGPVKKALVDVCNFAVKRDH